MATYDDIATNQHILNIANGIRAVTRTGEEMTIPEMPERLTSIRVVEHREVEVSLNYSSLVVSLGVYQQDVKHLFIVTPKTSTDAAILQRVKPEIELNYDAETGELSMGYQSPVDSLVTLLVVDLLLSDEAEDAGFLITQGGGGSIEPYSPDRTYELGEMFLYNRGTEESPNYAVGITIEAHEAEEYNENHSQVLATQIREDDEYLDLKDFAEQLLEHKSNTNNPHNVTKEQLGLGNVDNTSDEDKPISTAQQVEFNNINEKLTDNTTTNPMLLWKKKDGTDFEKRQLSSYGWTYPIRLVGYTDQAIHPAGTVPYFINTTDTAVGGEPARVARFSGLGHLGSQVTPNQPDHYTRKGYVDTQDNLKVDKVEGKGLSTNDYSNEEKTKLEQIQNGAQVNLIEKVLVNSVEQPIIDKTVSLTTPTKVSDLTDDTDVTPIKRAVADGNGNTISATYSKVADIVNSLLSDETTKVLSAAQGKALRELIEGKEIGRTYANIEAMVTSLNAEAADTFRVAFNLLIVDTEVPDFWVAEKMETSVQYTYTTDQALIDAIRLAPVQIGYYKISLSEVAKVDLTDYVKKTLTIAGLNLEQDITKAELQSALDFDTKVDKVTGKGLSEADFTSAEKTKLAGIQEGAQVNTVTGIKGNSEGTYRVGNVNITKANIGLGNAEDTADVNKNVLSATKLTTARTIAGVLFDGTQDIAIPFANLTSRPTTLSGYGITDAVTLSTPQTITAKKYFTGDIDTTNSTTGNGAITSNLLYFKNADPATQPGSGTPAEFPYTGFYQWGNMWEVSARDSNNRWVKTLFNINNVTDIATFRGDLVVKSKTSAATNSGTLVATEAQVFAKADKTNTVTTDSAQTITGTKTFTISPRNNSGGFAGGSGASATYGGAVGYFALATSGGAVGNNAKTGDGFAGGYNAKTVNTSNDLINAIQLGEGTNNLPRSLQVYNRLLMDAAGKIYVGSIPLSNPSSGILRIG